MGRRLVDRRLRARLPTARQRGGHRLAVLLAIGGVGLLAATAPLAGLALQQPQDPAPPRPAADTVPADTAPTARERALRRLRALPTTPIQRDTLVPDTVGAEDADPDSRVDTLPGEDGTPDLRRATPSEAAAGVLAPGADAVIVVRDSVDRTMAHDTIVRLLRGLEGYAVTEYSGEGAVFETEANVLRLTGDSRVGRDGRALRTDSVLVYEGERGVVCGYGNPILTGEGDPLESDVVCYDIERDLGMARGARTQFTQGATWYVRGSQNQVYMLTGGAQNRLYGSRTDFTSCELPEPHYTFRARSLKMVEGDVMIARDVTLRFEDVPVFWLPWMVQSMKRDRRSGLLTPQFGVNDIVRNSTGYNRHISNLGFYWAINDYMSAEVTGEWFSSNYTAMTTAFSYRWLDQFLNGGATIRQFWQEDGGRNLTVNTNNSWQPDERTRLNVSGTYASSTALVRRNSFDPSELNRQITSQGSINRSFGWGNANLGVTRRQSLNTDRVELTLPSASVSVSPLTLFSTADGRTALTYNASSGFDRRLIDVVDDPATADRDQRQMTANARHSLSFGRISVSQNANFTESLLHETTVTDSVVPEAMTQRLTWGSQVGYQQDLWTGTSLTPTLSITGDQLRSARTGDTFLEAPLRYQIGASLRTTVFGFWPGAGAFDAIRHKISPSLNWSYQPVPGEISPLQDTIFGVGNLREQNRLTLSLNQTFEARYATPDTAVADTASETGAPGEPRRLPQARKITLLALNTSASPGGFTYDFIQKRDEGRGFLTDIVRNTIRSDLVQGLQLSTTHDLFREGEVPDGGGLAPRTFAPHLTNLDARFSIDQGFWLFRLLGLGVAGGEPDQGAEADAEGSTGPAGSFDPSVEAEAPAGPGSIMRGSRGSMGDMPTPGGAGGWQASVNYSLVRPRPGTGQSPSQMVRGDLSFRPTEHWTVRWSTGYSFTTGEFSDHFLTLSRDLHRWRANFDFVRAQNGNFAMQFRVQLIDNPDLKLNYDQRTDPSQAGTPAGLQ